MNADFAQELLQARAAGPEAMKALAEKHLPLVLTMARRFPSAWSRNELCQQGVIGLMKALRHFDPSRGTSFSSYAAALILGEMRTLARFAQPLRIPRTEAALRRAIRQAEATLTATLHREPTISELAGEMHMDAAELMLHMEEITVTSTDALSPSGSSILDFLPDPEDWQSRLELCDILGKLPVLDRKLILLRYRLGLTQSQAGQRLGMTQMQVSRREAVIRTLLRRALAE